MKNILVFVLTLISLIGIGLCQDITTPTDAALPTDTTPTTTPTITDSSSVDATATTTKQHGNGKALGKDNAVAAAAKSGQGNVVAIAKANPVAAAAKAQPHGKAKANSEDFESALNSVNTLSAEPVITADETHHFGIYLSETAFGLILTGCILAGLLGSALTASIIFYAQAHKQSKAQDVPTKGGVSALQVL